VKKSLLIGLLVVTGCKGARSFLLGDPEAIPTMRPLPPPAPPPTSDLVPIPPHTATVPMKLADGTVASVDYTEAYQSKMAGQFMRAHLLLETKAFSENGTKDEQRLLREICTEQKDTDCVDKCNAYLSGKPYESIYEKSLRLAAKDPKTARALLVERQKKQGLGQKETELLHTICKKLKDATCSAPTPDQSAETPAENGGGDAEKARTLAGTNPKAARALLEPKAKAKKASQDELEILCAVCTIQHDKKCTATYCEK
jgi:hypothetical protein